MTAFDHTKSDLIDAMGVTTDNIHEFSDGVITGVAESDDVMLVIERVRDMLIDPSENGEITRRIVAALAVSMILGSVTADMPETVHSILH